MNHALVCLIIILILIVLLLTISLLSVLLWSAVLILQKLMGDISKAEGHSAKPKVLTGNSNGRNEEKRKEMVNRQPLPAERGTLRNTYSPKVPDRKEKSQFENLQKEMKLNQGESLKKDKLCINSPNMFSEQMLMSFIKGDHNADVIQIGIENPKGINQYGNTIVYKEDSTGCLIIYYSTSDICYVLPADEAFDCKDFDFGGLKFCFETNKEILTGKQYRVVGIEKPCTMKRNIYNEYYLEKKGILSVTEIEF